jgi:hypothetical protein
MFEQFLIRASMGEKKHSRHQEHCREFKTMFGYLYNYKDTTKNPCITYWQYGCGRRRETDGGENFNIKSRSRVQESIIKEVKSLTTVTGLCLQTLKKKHNVYIIDDPAGFKYDDLYTNILGDISCQRKVENWIYKI